VTQTLSTSLARAERCCQATAPRPPQSKRNTSGSISATAVRGGAAAKYRTTLPSYTPRLLTGVPVPPVSARCTRFASAPLHHPSVTRRRSPSARSSPSHRRHILCAAAVSAAASVVAACSNSLSHRHRAAAVTCALAYLLAFVAMLLCPAVPVQPSSSMKSYAAAADASHFLSLYVVAVFCCCTVAAAAAAQRQVVIKVPPRT
jgi:hypothetical protein